VSIRTGQKVKDEIKKGVSDRLVCLPLYAFYLFFLLNFEQFNIKYQG